MLLLYKSYNYINKQDLFFKLSRGSWVEGCGSRGEGVEGVFEIPIAYWYYRPIYIKIFELNCYEQHVGQLCTMLTGCPVVEVTGSLDDQRPFV